MSNWSPSSPLTTIPPDAMHALRGRVSCWGKATGNATANDLSQTGSIVFKPDVANPHLGKAIGVRLVKANGNALY